jgi:hypothetical protein
MADKKKQYFRKEHPKHVINQKIVQYVDSHTKKQKKKIYEKLFNILQ